MGFADKLKDLASNQLAGQSSSGAAAGGNTGAAGATSGATEGAAAGSSSGNLDFGDKGTHAFFLHLNTIPIPIYPKLTPVFSPGLDFIENKTGHKLSREQNEKITDGARGQFEKLTG